MYAGKQNLATRSAILTIRKLVEVVHGTVQFDKRGRLWRRDSSTRKLL